MSHQNYAQHQYFDVDTTDGSERDKSFPELYSRFSNLPSWVIAASVFGSDIQLGHGQSRINAQRRLFEWEGVDGLGAWRTTGAFIASVCIGDGANLGKSGL